MNPRYTERNDGGKYHDPVELLWADAWIADKATAECCPRFDIETEYAHFIERIDAAERLYLSLPPAARERTFDEPIDVDWESIPAWYEEQVQTSVVTAFALVERARAGRAS